MSALTYRKADRKKKGQADKREEKATEKKERLRSAIDRSKNGA